MFVVGYFRCLCYLVQEICACFFDMSMYSHSFIKKIEKLCVSLSCKFKVEFGSEFLNEGVFLLQNFILFWPVADVSLNDNLVDDNLHLGCDAI